MPCVGERHGRVAILGSIVVATIVLPSTFFTLYYLHLFDSWLWFYRVRSCAVANFYPGTVGFFAGWLVAILQNRVSRTLTIVATALFAVVPFVKPVLMPLSTSELREKWRDGICLQSTPSTCGPASVATILANRFGDNLSERTVALGSRSTATGTEIWYLAQFLRARGYEVSFRQGSGIGFPNSVAGTRVGNAGHFVAVLDCNDNGCRVADSLSGLVQSDQRVAFTGFFMQISRKALVGG